MIKDNSGEDEYCYLRSMVDSFITHEIDMKIVTSFIGVSDDGVRSTTPENKILNHQKT